MQSTGRKKSVYPGTREPKESAANSASPLRIILADDHALVRGGLALLIRILDGNAEILEANDFQQTARLLSEHPRVDLLLLDLLMPGMNGTEGVRSICHDWPDVPVVVVSVCEDADAIREALRAGAMGYIPKTSSPEVTSNALRFILSGGVYVPPHVLNLSDNETDAIDKTAAAPSAQRYEESTLLGLTERQLEVLRLLADGQSNKEIAVKLAISPGTVKMHVSRIFRVLKVENRTQAAARLSNLKLTPAR